METEYRKSIRPILDVYDKHRDLLSAESIELPKIVVVGDQSAGKSSVLESITGISFPRGQNTVTRCPIIIQSRGPKNDEEFAEIKIEGSKDAVNKVKLDKLSDAIWEAQNQLIKNEKKEITSTPINICLHKKDSPELTLFDLPGITYKNETLTSCIKEIIKKYTMGKDTVILLIIPANVDFTTSEAISLIRKNDDFKDRTLAVITKLDLALKEKNIFEKIKDNELELKFDPIVVRNRTQEELDKNESIEVVRFREMNIINEHEQLRNLPEQCKGTDQLILRLIEIQKEKLLTSKHEIRDKILNKLNEVNKALRSLPEPIVSIPEKMNVFKTCLRKFNNEYVDHCSGNNVEKEYNIPTRLREKFERFLNDNFQVNNSKYFSDNFNKEITDITMESKGLKLANFIDSPAFHLLLKREIENAKSSTFYLLEETYSYILSILLMICNKSFNLYPNLNRAVQSEIKNLMLKQKERTEKMMNGLLEVDSNVIFTINPYYLDLITKVKEKIVMLKDPNNQAQKPQQGLSNFFSSSSTKVISKRKDKINDIEVEIDDLQEGLISKSGNELESVVSNIQISLFAYMKLFEKRYGDYYFNIILFNIVNYFYTDEFLNVIDIKYAPNSNKEAEGWVVEGKDISGKRKNLEKSKFTLEKAFEDINNLF